MLRISDWPGYEMIESVVSAQECDKLLDDLAAIDKRSGRAGRRHLMSVPSVRNIAKDARMKSIADRIMQVSMIPFKATLFEKTGKANWLVAWHQDTALPLTEVPMRDGWGPTTIKEGVVYAHASAHALSRIVALRLHLDPSTRNNGPLRVIPRSHFERAEAIPEIKATEHSAVTCIVGKGGVIAMSPLTLHASSKCLSDDPRRVLHIEYAPTMEIEAGLSLAIA